MTSGRDPDEVLHHTALDPGTVDAILSGDLSPDDAPPGFTAAASLLRTAGGPASDEELVDRAGIVEALAAARPVPAAPVADLDAARSRRGMVTAKVAVIGIAAALGLTGVAAAAGLVTHQLRNDDRPVVTDQTTSTTDAVTSDPDGSDGSDVRVGRPPPWPVAPRRRSRHRPVTPGLPGPRPRRRWQGWPGPGRGPVHPVPPPGTAPATATPVGTGTAPPTATRVREPGNGSTNGNAGGVTPTLPPAAGGNGNANPNAAVPTLPPAAGGNGQGRGNPNAG